jgi:5'(3')-deoxyribonucleotidase
MKTTLFVDMDGVLCDLESIFLSHYPDKLYHTGCQETWINFRKLLIKLTCDNQVKLFENLKPTQTFDLVKDCIDKCMANDTQVNILTSLGTIGDDCDVRTQKKLWLKNNGLGHLPFFAVCECDHKCLLAHPNAILLDDSLKNCEQFQSMGGISIHYSVENHDKCEQQLKQILKF